MTVWVSPIFIISPPPNFIPSWGATAHDPRLGSLHSVFGSVLIRIGTIFIISATTYYFIRISVEPFCTSAKKNFASDKHGIRCLQVLRLRKSSWMVIRSVSSNVAPIRGKGWRYSPAEEIRRVRISSSLSLSLRFMFYY